MLLKTNKSFILLTLLIALSGYVIGYSISIFFSHQFLKGNARSILLMYRPSYDFIYLRNMMNSPNDLIRINSYYALFDYGKFDASILIDRYKQENTAYIKRILIWMMGFSEKKAYLKHFLTEEYSSALPGVKIEMLRTLKRLDINYYKHFIQEKSIDRSVLESVN
ncbi:MAG TPA: hypothetical protein PK544_11380 [Spirochaetota bacterium]|nr:hypothetical protein [Spirochaetota bacterium]